MDSMLRFANFFFSFSFCKTWRRIFKLFWNRERLMTLLYLTTICRYVQLNHVCVSVVEFIEHRIYAYLYKSIYQNRNKLFFFIFICIRMCNRWSVKWVGIFLRWGSIVAYLLVTVNNTVAPTDVRYIRELTLYTHCFFFLQWQNIASLLYIYVFFFTAITAKRDIVIHYFPHAYFFIVHCSDEKSSKILFLFRIIVEAQRELLNIRNPFAWAYVEQW